MRPDGCGSWGLLRCGNSGMVSLRQLADSLARHNNVEFNHNGMKVQARVPAEVTVEVEFEAESDESSIEVEISW